MVFQVYRNLKHKTISRLSNQQNTSGGRLPRILELLLQFFTITIAASIVGTAAHVYQTHKQQVAAKNPVWLPLWPGHFETTAPKVLIGTASAILFLSLIYVAISFVPRFNSKNQPKLSALSLTAVSTLSILLTISSLAVTHMLESRDTETDTIKSWTCKFSDAGKGQTIAKFMSNDDFDTLCTESRFAFYALIPVLITQILLLGVGVTRFFKSKRSPDSPMLGDKSSDY